MLRLKDGITFARIKGEDFAAGDITKDPSVKITTPDKVIPSRVKGNDDDTLAKSVVSHDTKNHNIRQIQATIMPKPETVANAKSTMLPKPETFAKFNQP